MLLLLGGFAHLMTVQFVAMRNMHPMVFSHKLLAETSVSSTQTTCLWCIKICKFKWFLLTGANYKHVMMYFYFWVMHILHASRIISVLFIVSKSFCKFFFSRCNQSNNIEKMEVYPVRGACNRGVCIKHVSQFCRRLCRPSLKVPPPPPDEMPGYRRKTMTSVN